MFMLLGYTLSAGFCILIGGILARLVFFKRHTRERKFIHAMMSLGSGILLASVSFVLVPEGLELLNPFQFIASFLIGVFFFRFVSQLISRSGGSYSQLMAMLMDFLPEALALGASYVAHPRLALVLAVFIGMQNIPEGFNAFHEIHKTVKPFHKIAGLLLLASVSGVIPAIIGYSFLGNTPEFIAMVMMFASGGILYLIMEDIAPEAPLRTSTLPSIMATIGFLIGMTGHYFLV